MNKVSTPQQRLDLARACLNVMDIPAEGRDGVRDAAMAFAFGTGIEIHTPGGELWRPAVAVGHVAPGTANFHAAREALADGRLKFTTGDVSQLIECARADKAAHDALHLLARHRADDPPRGLPEWLAEHPSRPRGGAYSKRYRDDAIRYAVHCLVEFEGLSPTQNDANGHGNSACAVVAVAASMDYGAVRKAWDKRGR